MIDQELVDTGKLLWVDKHLPLRVHPYAALAAVAAECAGDQQQYWEMHGRLHAESERWINDNAENALLALAAELQLDMPEFRSCLDSRNGLERVLKDLYDAQGLITKAPTFVILQDGRGSATGPLPGDQFVTLLSKRLEAIDEAIDKSEAVSTESGN
jgi:protein-disulfide isomerase